MLKDRDITAMARPHLIAPALLYLSRRWEVLCFLLMLTLLYLQVFLFVFDADAIPSLRG